MKTFKAAFVLEKETKGAVQYKEVDEGLSDVKTEDYKIGTLYIRKTALEPPPWPRAIVVEVKHG